MIKLSRKLLAAGVVVSMVFGAAGVAEADSVVADGDGLAPVANNDLAFGTVCAGSTTTKSVPLALFRNQGGVNVFANGSTVTVSRSNQTGVGIDAVMSSSTITMPSNWEASPDGTTSPTATSSVTFTAGTTAGTVAGSVTYTASGKEAQKSGSLTREDVMNVTATVSNAGACAPDTTPPVISGMPADQTVEATGPGGATATWTAPTAHDLVDGARPVTCSPVSGSTFAIAEAPHAVTCTASDTRNNTATAGFTVTVSDTTAPVISGMPADQTIEATGADGATATWTAPTANDLVDGARTVSCSAAPGATFALGATLVTCTTNDTRSNAASASFTVTVSDTTAPGITFQGGPVDGETYLFGSVPAAPTCAANDTVSGSVSCTVTGWANTVGPHTMTASATDPAGNTGIATRSYTVKAWTLSGFYQPVDMNVTNTVKAGSTVPLKFEAFAGTQELTALATVGSFKVSQITCGSVTSATEDTEQYTSGSTTLRYDSTGGQFIQNWQVPKSPAGICYRVTLTLADGTPATANFKTK